MEVQNVGTGILILMKDFLLTYRSNHVSNPTLNHQACYEMRVIAALLSQRLVSAAF